MLVLSRKLGETVCIGSEITVTIVELKGNRVKIGIEAPKQFEIWRGELCVEPSPSTGGADRARPVGSACGPQSGPCRLMTGNALFFSVCSVLSVASLISRLPAPLTACGGRAFDIIGDHCRLPSVSADPAQVEFSSCRWNGNLDRRDTMPIAARPPMPARARRHASKRGSPWTSRRRQY
jgi:carbon storage regulator